MSEEEFISYSGNYLKIVTVDGRTVEGFAISFTWADDSDDGEAELEIEVNEHRSEVVSQSEVKTIEIIDN